MLQRLWSYSLYKVTMQRHVTLQATFHVWHTLHCRCQRHASPSEGKNAHRLFGYMCSLLKRLMKFQWSRWGVQTAQRCSMMSALARLQTAAASWIWISPKTWRFVLQMSSGAVWTTCPSSADQTETSECIQTILSSSLGQMSKFATMMWRSDNQPVHSVTSDVQHVMTNGGENSGVAESYICQQGSLSEETFYCKVMWETRPSSSLSFALTSLWTEKWLGSDFCSSPNDVTFHTSSSASSQRLSAPVTESNSSQC